MVHFFLSAFIRYIILCISGLFSLDCLITSLTSKLKFGKLKNKSGLTGSIPMILLYSSVIAFILLSVLIKSDSAKSNLDLAIDTSVNVKSPISN